MNTPKKLPIFKGYTVDVRLGEFRKVWWNNGVANMKTIPFESTQGARLLEEYEKVK